MISYISSFSFWSGYLSSLNIEYFNFNLDPNLIIQAYLQSADKLLILAFTGYIPLSIIIRAGVNDKDDFNSTPIPLNFIVLILCSVSREFVIFYSSSIVSTTDIIVIIIGILSFTYFILNYFFSDKLVFIKHSSKKNTVETKEDLNDTNTAFQIFLFQLPATILAIMPSIIPGIFFYYGVNICREKTQ